MSININSEAACRKAYLNYHCYGNSMGISAREMGEITQTWSDRLSSWQASVSSDENEYEFDDSDYANYKENGKATAKETTGHDGKTGGQIANGVVDATLSVAGALGTTVASGAANFAAKSIGGSFLGGVMGKASTKISEKAGEGAGEKATKNIGWIVTAPLALAVAAKYMASKPNKDAKEACDALQTEMTGAQATLGETQEEMSAMGEEIMSLSDEALAVNEDANENIEEQKTEYDMYYQTLLAIQEKVDAGEPLTDSEKDLYKEVIGYLNEIGISIGETSEDTTDAVVELYDEMDTYQDGYDVAAETMGEIEGLTDYAESFDSTTQTMCYIEGASQGLNAASGVKAGVDAGRFAAAGGLFTAWAWGFAAMGASAGVMSGIGTAEQFKWAGEVGTEIEMRKETQDLNTNTMDMYDEEIDAYDGWMQGVEDLELEIPDDIEPVEDTALPTDTPTGEDAVPDNLKPKKEENEQK